MSFSLIPDYSFPDICKVTPEFLKEKGIRLLLLDLDNTMAPYGTVIPTREIAEWAETVRQSGIETFILTNNNGSERVEALSKALDMGYIMGAKKPFVSGINRALDKLGFRHEETALAGDQIFTDVLAANCAGITSIIVRPIKIVNPLLNVRYWLEAPFRALCPNKM
ncbi:MAG TPA: YqeG family HAD IIIA-type phosphatase [Papillibacter sp.]|jgi:HAD superfamily phosphatase (TIGR01668 family)|nr:YqeG family HAD IIIA-type phosphatase [Papillibacter sp.]